MIHLRRADAWPEPVEGHKLLNEINGLLSRYMHMPKGASAAVSLWVLHTYALEAADVTPYIAVISPEPECGKTTLLTLLNGMVDTPIMAASITGPALRDVVGRYQPTLLIDELDAFMKGSASESSEAMRGLLNSGFSKNEGAQILMEPRTDKDGVTRYEAATHSTFCPKVLSRIGPLHDTLMSRSIVIRLQRALNGENERLPRYMVADLTHDIARKCRRWVDDNIDTLNATRWPAKMPTGLGARAWERWAPLVSIADAAGGPGEPWRSRARHAARALELADYQMNEKEQLLTDAREVVVDKGDDFVPASGLLEALLKVDRWRLTPTGKPLTATKLGTVLGAYGVTKVAKKRERGYDRGSLLKAADRYLGDGLAEK